ncbi:hypothetical protein NT07LI_3813, partial [Listeria innocua FSL S4-378]
MELAVIFKYFKILPNTLRPSITASFNTVKLFSSKITELASFVISAAVSTEIPTSAFLSAGASLIPSPRKPTVCPAFFSKPMIRDFCIGVNFAKMWYFRNSRVSSSSDKSSISPPSKNPFAGIPTSSQIRFVTISLSPVKTFTLIWFLNSCVIASFVDDFTGSRKPKNPAIIICSSSFLVN